MLRIAHTSDWHWEAEKLEKCQASSNFIISKLQELKPDLHIITGDYWNRKQTLSKASAFLPAIAALREMANICPLVIIKGNNEHDAEDSIKWFEQLETKYPIFATERAETILYFDTTATDYPYFQKLDYGVPQNPEAQKSMLNQAAALIHLFPYPTKAHFLAEAGNLSIDESNRAIEEALKQMFLGMGLLSDEVQCPVIFAGHCNVSGATLSTGQVLLGQDIMINKHELELARADYYALGHIHKAQTIAPTMHYAGSIYHCNFGETEKKSFNLVTIEGIYERGSESDAMKRKVLYSKNIEPIEIPSRPLSLHECEIDALLPGTLKDINPSAQWNDWINTDLRIRFYQTKEQAGQITDDQLKGFYAGAYSYTIERITIPDERIRSSEIADAALNLAGKVKVWAKAIGKELPEEVSVLANEIERSAAQ